ncbi:MAG: hypothetical protein HY332_04905 [Chloroflexi bacterium]|nr:hypothetical protein [Chloroflexota bacterium]
MTIIRRVYWYAVAFVSLLMLLAGASGLGRALLQAVLDEPGRTIASNLRSEVTQNGALLLVGLPVWLLHWAMANRAARRDSDERAATLRRLFIYAVLASMVLAGATAAQGALEAFLRLLVRDATAATVSQALLPLPRFGIAVMLWLYHRHVAAVDRRLAGEQGGAATLRCWYTYGVALVALVVLLVDASRLLRLTWEIVVTAFDASLVQAPGAELAGASATALIALAVWLTHWTGWAVAAGAGSQRSGATVAAQDARSVLRPVYLFLALAVSVAATLWGASQLLFYALGRLLGVDRPGGVGGNLLLAMAGPVSLVVVYGASWLYQRHALADQARAQPELPRQAGIRRLYTYLISLIALALFATGVGGLLWTLADLITNAPHTINPDTWWREQTSRNVTLIAIGLPVWLLHWGPVSGPRADRDEVASLSRRIYVYLTLLIGVLVLLGTGAFAAKEILDLALGEAATPSVITDLVRALAVAAVAAVTVFYHQRVLRGDVAAVAQAPGPGEAAIPEAVPVPVPAGPPLHERPFGVVYQRAGASEESSWFASADEARAAYEQLRDQADGRVEWIALVRAEAYERQGPAGAAAEPPA